MATTLENLIVAGRRYAGDAPDSNQQRSEMLNNPDLGYAINGTNKTFAILNWPVVNVVNTFVDGVQISSQYYTVDFANGFITYNTAPAVTAFITYYFYLMLDADWVEFVTYGLQACGYSTGDPTRDVPTLPEAILPAVKMYACAAWALRMSNQTGLWYNQRLQERIEDREQVSAKFLKLSEQMSKEADAQRDDAYKGQGKQFGAAFKILNHAPRVYTPYR